MLHAFPNQRLRIDIQLPHILDVENPPMFFQVSVDRGIFIFEEAIFDRVVLVGGAPHAEEFPRAPFDDVGVEEHGLVI